MKKAKRKAAVWVVEVFGHGVWSAINEFGRTRRDAERCMVGWKAWTTHRKFRIARYVREGK